MVIMTGNRFAHISQMEFATVSLNINARGVLPTDLEKNEILPHAFLSVAINLKKCAVI